ncbi:MAG: hypothetical protein EZS28_000249 [Streblomastix strix]|uniref:Uncharacterized protein n=1 Tax=Streblomastix strix TaxID=222440 RepID=A0A5J4XCI2_9EUKA|nr:MAG: hypothetical protein EZS28_000249 [Streblomastix strix]
MNRSIKQILRGKTLVGPPMTSRQGKINAVGAMLEAQKRAEFEYHPRQVSKEYDEKIKSMSADGGSLTLANTITKVVQIFEKPAQEKPQKNQVRKGKSSSFLAPNRDYYVSPEQRASKENPGVGRYTINYSVVDSQQHMPNPKAKYSPSFMGTGRDFTIHQEPDRTQYDYTQRSKSNSAQRSMLQTYNYKLRPDQVNTEEQQGQPIDNSTKLPRLSLTSSFITKNQRMKWETPSDCKEDFYVTHETNIESNTHKPRTLALPMPNSGRDAKASIRSNPVMIDHLYDPDFNAVAPKTNMVLSNMKLESTRDHSVICTSTQNSGGMFGKVKMTDVSYNVNDQVQSKRRSQPTAQLAYTMGTPALSNLLFPPTIVYNTSTDKDKDTQKIDVPVRPRTDYSLKFGEPKNPAFSLARKPPKHTMPPNAVTDQDGNLLPAEMYDVKIDATRIHFQQPVPFFVTAGRPALLPGLTSEIDHIPDQSAALGLTLSEAQKEQQLERQKENQRLEQIYQQKEKERDFQLMGESGQVKQTEQQEGQNEKSQTLRNSLRKNTSNSRRAPVPRAYSNPPNLSHSLKLQHGNNVPLALVMPTLLNPGDGEGQALVAAGTRQHINIQDFGVVPTREYVDPLKWNDAPIDKMYSKQQAYNGIDPHIPKTELKKISGRDQPIIMHRLIPNARNDLFYDPKLDCTTRHEPMATFGTAGKKGEFNLDRSLGGSSFSNVPYYDYTLKLVKPRTQITVINPLPQQQGI